MTLVSQQGPIEDAIVALLVADTPALNGVTITLGNPGVGIAKEAIYIADEADADWEPDVTMSTTPSFEELYEVGIVCFVARSGPDYKAVRDRCYALAGEVTKVLGANRKLSNTCNDSYPVHLHRSVGVYEKVIGVQLEVTLHARVQVA